MPGQQQDITSLLENQVVMFWGPLIAAQAVGFDIAHGSIANCLIKIGCSPRSKGTQAPEEQLLMGFMRFVGGRSLFLTGRPKR